MANDSLFFSSSGGITPASFFLLLGAPLLLSGQFVWGCVAVALALVVALKAAMEDIKEADKHEIRCNILDPEDLVAELEALEESDSNEESKRTQFLASLGALAKKYSKKDKAKNK